MASRKTVSEHIWVFLFLHSVHFSSFALRGVFACCHAASFVSELCFMPSACLWEWWWVTPISWALPPFIKLCCPGSCQSIPNSCWSHTSCGAGWALTHSSVSALLQHLSLLFCFLQISLELHAKHSQPSLSQILQMSAQAGAPPYFSLSCPECAFLWYRK